MRKMENFEYKYIIKELKGALEGKRFERIRKAGDHFRIKIGNKEIICEPGARFHETLLKEEAEKDGFCEKIEKELKGAILRRIYQLNEDRIIAMDFGDKKLIMEMFGKGNIILIDKEGTIIWVLREEEWKTRKIKRGERYAPPPKKDYEGKYVIIPLIDKLGKKYAKRVLEEARVGESRKGEEVSEEERRRIEEAVERLEREAKPYIIKRGDAVEDFSLFKEEGAEECSAFSECIDRFFALQSKKDPKLEKLKRRLEAQKKRLEEVKEEEKEFRKIAEEIYKNYEKVQKLLEEARKGKIKLDKERAFEVEL